MSGLNTLIRLPAADSTNAWAKANLDRFGPVGAVYTTNQTAGRGRLGRAWANAAGQALYYTAVLRLPLADPGALPLYASLAVAAALHWWKGNNLLSIFSATILYMILVQAVF